MGLESHVESLKLPPEQQQQQEQEEKEGQGKQGVVQPQQILSGVLPGFRSGAYSADAHALCLGSMARGVGATLVEGPEPSSPPHAEIVAQDCAGTAQKRQRKMTPKGLELERALMVRKRARAAARNRAEQPSGRKNEQEAAGKWAGGAERGCGGSGVNGRRVGDMSWSVDVAGGPVERAGEAARGINGRMGVGECALSGSSGQDRDQDWESRGGNTGKSAGGSLQPGETGWEEWRRNGGRDGGTDSRREASFSGRRYREEEEPPWEQRNGGEEEDKEGEKNKADGEEEEDGKGSLAGRLAGLGASYAAELRDGLGGFTCRMQEREVATVVMERTGGAEGGGEEGEERKASRPRGDEERETVGGGIVLRVADGWSRRVMQAEGELESGKSGQGEVGRGRNGCVVLGCEVESERDARVGGEELECAVDVPVSLCLNGPFQLPGYSSGDAAGAVARLDRRGTRGDGKGARGGNSSTSGDSKGSSGSGSGSEGRLGGCGRGGGGGRGRGEKGARGRRRGRGRRGFGGRRKLRWEIGGGREVVRGRRRGSDGEEAATRVRRSRRLELKQTEEEEEWEEEEGDEEEEEDEEEEDGEEEDEEDEEDEEEEEEEEEEGEGEMQRRGWMGQGRGVREVRKSQEKVGEKRYWMNHRKEEQQGDEKDEEKEEEEGDKEGQREKEGHKGVRGVGEERDEVSSDEKEVKEQGGMQGGRRAGGTGESKADERKGVGGVCSRRRRATSGSSSGELHASAGLGHAHGHGHGHGQEQEQHIPVHMHIQDPPTLPGNNINNNNTAAADGIIDLLSPTLLVATQEETVARGARVGASRLCERGFRQQARLPRQQQQPHRTHSSPPILRVRILERHGGGEVGGEGWGEEAAGSAGGCGVCTGVESDGAERGCACG
ncbi:unnamed protein product [Closterium sp. NIES-64]|nr:unnamed protein product [Closterium sp. NIES-64]